MILWFRTKKFCGGGLIERKTQIEEVNDSRHDLRQWTKCLRLLQIFDKIPLAIYIICYLSSDIEQLRHKIGKGISIGCFI